MGAARPTAKSFVPHGHCVNVTLVAAVRLSGPLAAPSFVGAMNQARFHEWLRRHGIPRLKHNGVVVLDGSSCHCAVQARELVERARRRLLFPPPYSPDFKPEENLWSKTKAMLRRWKHRTVEPLLSAVHEAVKPVTPKDCRGFFEHCGYST